MHQLMLQYLSKQSSNVPLKHAMSHKDGHNCKVVQDAVFNK